MIVFRKVLTGPTSFVYVFPIDLVSFKYLVMEVLIAPYSRKFVCIPYIFDQFIQTSVFSDTTSPIRYTPLSIQLW